VRSEEKVKRETHLIVGQRTNDSVRICVHIAEVWSSRREIFQRIAARDRPAIVEIIDDHRGE
jgi:hypothetical protein